MKKDVPVRSGEFDFEIRTPDGRLNIENFGLALKFIVEKIRDKKTVSILFFL